MDRVDVLSENDKQLLLYRKDFEDEEHWIAMSNFRPNVLKIVQEHGWKKGCELGVRKGGLLFLLLSFCTDLEMIAVDAWESNKADDGHTFPHMSYEAMVRKQGEKYTDRLKIIKGYTHKVVDQVPDNSLDFIFIDADHSYNSCKRDIQMWSSKVKDSGYLLGDDIERALGVKKAVSEVLPGYETPYPNVWMRKKCLK